MFQCFIIWTCQEFVTPFTCWWTPGLSLVLICIYCYLLWVSPNWNVNSIKAETCLICSLLGVQCPASGPVSQQVFTRDLWEKLIIQHSMLSLHSSQSLALRGGERPIGFRARYPKIWHPDILNVIGWRLFKNGQSSQVTLPSPPWLFFPETGQDSQRGKTFFHQRGGNWDNKFLHTNFVKQILILLVTPPPFTSSSPNLIVSSLRIGCFVV